MEVLLMYSPLDWSLILLAAFIIGLSKAGLKGIDMMNVTLMAIVFGGKASTGIVLPLLCFADVLAVKYYNRHAQWPHFIKLMPWMIVGLLIGAVAGKELNEMVFRKVMAVIILLTIGMMLMLEFRKQTILPTNRPFVATMGLSAGFTTMLGNLAGAFSNLYFLAMRMPKNDFIGTAAWLFLAINFFKLPFQAFYWKNINATTLKTDLVLVPALIAGFWIGIKLVAKIREDSYRKIVVGLTILGAMVIFFKR